eukprot:5453219-Lingulodinium_polyedra.AAC.1
MLCCAGLLRRPRFERSLRGPMRGQVAKRRLGVCGRASGGDGPQKAYTRRAARFAGQKCPRDPGSNNGLGRF